VQWDGLVFFNLIKITSLSCSHWLTCRGVGDLKKPHYGLNARESRSRILNEMINMGYDFFDQLDQMWAVFQLCWWREHIFTNNK
jgi:hypothetical protein